MAVEVAPLASPESSLDMDMNLAAPAEPMSPPSTPDAPSSRASSPRNPSPPSPPSSPQEIDPDGLEGGLSAAQSLLAEPPRRVSPHESVDFLLHPAELAKGRTAAENYLSTFRSDESRHAAEEALETLATVISGGKCDSVEFPWQQVRPYHGAAALTILKEKGAPARIEALRCRRDTTRSYRVVPDAYAPRQVEKIRSTLSKVIEECSELGLLSEEESESARVAVQHAKRRTASKKTASKGARKAEKPKAASSRGRLLGDGELRALVAASAADANAAGCRDAVFFSLVYRGLKIAEISGLTLESVRFSNKTGACHIVARPGRSGGRGRRVEMTNDELICLEDWLDYRGDGPGPLLCTLGRGGKPEGKRLTTAMLKEICEQRAAQAKVAPFAPNDLSRSADALTEHRKAARRRAAKVAQESMSTAERVLYDGTVSEQNASGEAIQFPFLGLLGLGI